MEKVHAASEGKFGIKDSKHHFNIKLKDKDDFDRETAWDMIGILTILVVFETAVITGLS